MGRDFKKIKAWEYADNLSVMIYSITKTFPREELYGLTSQLRRAAVSVPTNIVEGANRGHKKEYLRFLYIAQGPIAEVEYLLHLARRLNYLKQKEYEEIARLREETARTPSGLMNAIRKEVNGLET